MAPWHVCHFCMKTTKIEQKTKHHWLWGLWNDCNDFVPFFKGCSYRSCLTREADFHLHLFWSSEWPLNNLYLRDNCKKWICLSCAQQWAQFKQLQSRWLVTMTNWANAKIHFLSAHSNFGLTWLPSPCPWWCAHVDELWRRENSYLPSAAVSLLWVTGGAGAAAF